MKPKRLIGGMINSRGRWVPDAPICEPFYCFAMGGSAVRNGHKIARAGWYYDNGRRLQGPFRSKREAAQHARDNGMGGTG